MMQFQYSDSGSSRIRQTDKDKKMGDKLNDTGNQATELMSREQPQKTTKFSGYLWEAIVMSVAKLSKLAPGDHTSCELNYIL